MHGAACVWGPRALRHTLGEGKSVHPLCRGKRGQAPESCAASATARRRGTSWRLPSGRRRPPASSFARPTRTRTGEKEATLPFGSKVSSFAGPWQSAVSVCERHVVASLSLGSPAGAHRRRHSSVATTRDCGSRRAASGSRVLGAPRYHAKALVCQAAACGAQF